MQHSDSDSFFPYNEVQFHVDEVDTASVSCCCHQGITSGDAKKHP